MKIVLPSSSTGPQSIRLGRNRKVLGFSAVAVLGGLLLVNPTLFCVALMAGFVVTTWFPAISLPTLPVPSASRNVARLADAAPALLVGVAAAWMAFTASLPVDDLLRHILARGWNYDYVPHYANHILPTHWSWTIGFDMLVGAIQNRTHDVLTTSRIIRAAETAFVGAMLLLAVNSATTNKALRFVALSVALYGLVWPRLQLGRPEIFFTGLVFAATFMSRRLWLGLYVLMAPLYVFAPIYVVAALMLGRQDENIRRRIVLNCAIAGVAVASTVVFWMVYTGGEYPVVFGLLRQVLLTQEIKHMQVGELLPLLAAMASPLALTVLLVLLCLSWTHAKRLAQRPAERVQFLTILAVAACFCIPDYVRLRAHHLVVVRCCSPLCSRRRRNVCVCSSVGLVGRDHVCRPLDHTKGRSDPRRPPGHATRTRREQDSRAIQPVVIRRQCGEPDITCHPDIRHRGCHPARTGCGPTPDQRRVRLLCGRADEVRLRHRKHARRPPPGLSQARGQPWVDACLGHDEGITVKRRHCYGSQDVACLSQTPMP